MSGMRLVSCCYSGPRGGVAAEATLKISVMMMMMMMMMLLSYDLRNSSVFDACLPAGSGRVTDN